MSVTVDVERPGAIETALFNPYLREMRADPWPVLHRLRDLDPVYESPMRFFIVTGYDAAVKVLSDARLSVDPKNARVLSDLVGDQVLGYAQRGFDHVMLFTDPPDHTRLRALVNKAFTPRAVERLRPRMQEIVDRLLDEVADARSMDVVEDLAYPLPVTVICELMGIPPEDHATFRQWALDIAPILDPFVAPNKLQSIAEAGFRLLGYFDDLIAARRRDASTDLISELIRAEDEGDKLTPEELRATCILLLVAGLETTMNFIGNATLALLNNPDEMQRLAQQPSIARSAIEELLRHDGPGTLTARIALEPLELGGKTVQPGQVVIAMIGGANRDPDVFRDPDRLDLTRQPNRHVAFSAGAHFCLGAMLARAESQIALSTLVRRMPELELDGEPKWRETVTFRGLESLRVRF